MTVSDDSANERTLGPQVVAEAQLRESEERFRQLTENLDGVFYLTDVVEKTFLHVSGGFESLWGLPIEDLYADPQLWRQAVHPDDLASLHSGPVDGPLEQEYRIFLPDGEMRWVRERSFPVRQDDDDRSRVAGFALDITESKQLLAEQALAEAALEEAKERYRSLFEDMPIGLYRRRADGEIVDANLSYAEMFGFAAVQDVLGRNVSEFYVDAGDIDAVNETLATKGIIRDRLVRVRRPDGSLMWASVTARNASDGRGGAFYEGAVEDVTQQVEADEQKRALESQLLQSQKMEAVGKLAGGVAHDFNNLLSVIQNYATFALEDLEQGGKTSEDINEVLKAAQRAATLTQQLLTFSRRDVVRPELLDVNETIRHFEKLLQGMVGEDIELSTDLDPDLDPVEVDKTQFEQVIMNLVVNAKEALPPGGHLSIKTEPRDERVVIEVADDGVGMPPEVVDRIFEPFFTTKPLGSGTGLGLSTVFGIVQGCGGTIEVNSEPGAGTVFRILLPTSQGKVSPQANDPAQTRMFAEPAKTILLAEDEASVRAVVRRILERHGYEVLEAPGAAEALDLWDEHRSQVSLVLTDVVMPRMSGIELSERLTERGCVSPTVFMSGYNEEMAKSRGLRESRSLITKPFSAQELLSKIAEALAVGAGPN